MFDQFPTRRAYSDRIALFCAQLSDLAYREFQTKDQKDGLTKELGGIGAKLLGQISESRPLGLVEGEEPIDTQAIYVEHIGSGVRVIAFRGTEANDMKDWVTDARIDLERLVSGVEIHKGFLNAYDLVHDQIEDWIKDAGDHPVFTCGHSLGGALAVVASVRNRSTPLDSCYTFGGPRVGLIAREKIKTPVYRVTNQSDPVPDVPPASFFQSKYRHIGDEYQLREDQPAPELISGDHVVDKIAEALEDVWSFAQHFFGDSLEDAVRKAVKARADAHASGLYVERLEKIAQARNLQDEVPD